MQNSVTVKVKDDRAKMTELITKLDTLSPLKTLARGYTLTTDASGKVINSSKNIKKDEELVVKFYDGDAKVKAI